jgi:UDP-GlcNAc:undecaprenyl-phosphate GlcNAc-1-phosphate transferase
VPVLVVLGGIAAWGSALGAPGGVLITLAAGLATWLLTPVVAKRLLRARIVAHPGGHAGHRGVVPYGGGLTIALVFTACVGWMIALFGPPDASHCGLLAGALLMLGVGAWDDVRGVSARGKVAAQIVAALCLVAAGVRLPALDVPGLGTLALGVFEIPLLVFWVVLVTNAINVVDSMDGVAMGIAAIALAGLLFLGVLPLFVVPLLGCVLGFLPHNLHRARVFAGDAGSMSLGFVLAVLLLEVPVEANVPVMIGLVAYPLGDATFAVVRRTIRGKPFFTGDRGHVHHLVAGILGSVPAAVAVAWGLALLAAVFAVRAPGLAYLIGLVLAWGVLGLFLAAGSGARPSRVLASRPAMRAMARLRSRARREIAAATTIEEVHEALARVAEQLPLVSVEVGPIRIAKASPGDPSSRRVVERFGTRRATWAYVPPPDEDEALDTERHVVVHDLLRRVDRSLDKMRRAWERA